MYSRKTISLKHIINIDLQVADILAKLLLVSAHELHTQFLIKGHYGIIMPKCSDLINRRATVKMSCLKMLTDQANYKIKHKAKT